MAIVLKRKLTINDKTSDIHAAILKLAIDKNQRLLLTDENEWLQMKLGEIARLTRILKKQFSNDMKPRK